MLRGWMPLAGVVAIALTGMLPATASAATKFVSVQVYQLCDDGGSNCAPLGLTGNDYFEVETNKIWAQADIHISFNFVQQINSTLFSTIDDNTLTHGFQQLTDTYSTHNGSTTVVDMFLVHTIVSAYGEGWLGFGGLAIGMDDVLSFNGGLGRIDTIAHELGHNLGLLPTGFNNEDGAHHSTNPNHLIAPGGIRNVPSSLADIFPDGLGLDIIPADQVTLARSSSLLQDAVPEPVSVALVGSGLVVFGFLRRRKAA